MDNVALEEEEELKYTQWRMIKKKVVATWHGKGGVRGG